MLSEPLCNKLRLAKILVAGYSLLFGIIHSRIGAWRNVNNTMTSNTHYTLMQMIGGDDGFMYFDERVYS